ncbi:MAG: hypothetical protein ACOX6W_04330 [Lentisphaeria bacterium]|jgi:hypothetical protein
MMSGRWMQAAMAVLFGCVHLSAANLIRNGSFDGEAAVQEFRTNGGKFSVHTEELTWNKCGRLEIDRVNEKDGVTVHSAVVWIGSNGTVPGFDAKPNTTYRFSIEVRGEVPGRASLSARCWYGDNIWTDGRTVSASVGGFKVQSGWTVYKGTFTTSPDTKRVALQLQMWESTQYGPLAYKVGDGILFDNIEVVEDKRDLGMAVAASGSPAVRKRRAARTGRCQGAIVIDGRLDEADWQQAPATTDFLALGKDTPAAASTIVAMLSDAENIYLGIRCQEPDKVTAQQVDNGLVIWRDDVIEVFFGPLSSDRQLSQFVICAGGGRYQGYGNESTLPVDYAAWEGKASVGDGFWQAELRIPFRCLAKTGFGADGDTISFNVSRQRRAAKELSTWSRLRESFHEVENFGVLALVDFNAALTKLTGQTGADVADAEAFAQALHDYDQKQQQAQYERLANRKFAVAPVPVTANFAIPFIPEEVFSPVDEITVTAAVNELKGVPIALANLTDLPAEYQVILETKGRYNGKWGLEGFPPEQFVMRQAVRFKDSDDDPGSLRLDPLPKMNQASTLMVLPKEAGLVWLDFDTTGVAPGSYEGRLRIIPLSEVAKWESIKGAYWNRKYTGDMQDIPFTLVVRNIVLDRDPSLPMGFFQAADNELCFKMMIDIGVRNIGLLPWSFRFPVDDKGDIIPDGVTEKLQEQGAIVTQHEEWARKYGVSLTYFIGFSAYDAFGQVYGLSRKPERKKQVWPQWIKALEGYMRSLGVEPERYVIETWDEPHPDKFPELLESHQLAKAGSSRVRLSLTLGAHIMPVDKMASLAPYTDEWTLWSDGYFQRPEHVQLIREQQQRGVLIRHYTCDTSMRSSLARRYRRNNWFGEYHRLDGNEMFHFADTYGGRGASDWKVTTRGGIVYKLFDEYMPSIRYMALRQGMTDVKYLAALRKLAAGNPEAQAFLEAAPRRVVVDFGHDPAMPDIVRAEAVELILKLQAGKAK